MGKFPVSEWSKYYCLEPYWGVKTFRCSFFANLSLVFLLAVTKLIVQRVFNFLRILSKLSHMMWYEVVFLAHTIRLRCSVNLFHASLDVNVAPGYVVQNVCTLLWISDVSFSSTGQIHAFWLLPLATPSFSFLFLQNLKLNGASTKPKRVDNANMQFF